MRTFLLLSLVVSLAAQADCPRPEGLHSGAVAGKSDAERLDFLVNRLRHDSVWAQRRTALFGGGLSAAAIGQLALAPLLPENERPAMYWGAGSSLVGVASVLFNPLDVLYGGSDFAKRAANASPEEACALIAEGERMLFNGARQALAARAWYMHVLNVAFNVGVGMVLGFVHKLWTNAVVNGLVGIAIGEAMLFTIPLGLVHGSEDYRGKASPVSFMVSPTAGPGLGVTMTF